MRKTVLLGLCCLSLVACKKSSSDSDGTSPPKATGEAADALWAQAPDKLAGGIVATGGALAAVDPILDELRLLSKDPELGLVAQAIGQIDGLVGKPDQHLADVGVDASKGFAFFQTEDKVMFAILPMGDRDKLVKTLRGSRGAKEGDPDTVMDLKCNVIKDAYVCADSDLKAIGDRMGKGPGAKVIGAKVAATGARGDAEMYLANSLVKVSGYDELAAAAALGHGAIDVRFFLSGKSTAPPLVALVNAPRTKPELANPGGYIAADVTLLIAATTKDLPNIPLPGGSKPAELMATIKGPVTVRMAQGTADFNVRAPLTDPAPFTKLIENCGALGLFLTLADKQEPGSCALAVKAGYPMIVVWVENGELRISTKKGAVVPGAKDILTPVGKELSTGDWSYAIWGRGSVFGQNRLALPPMPDGMPAETTLALRGIGALSEMGTGVKVDADGIRGRIYVRTIWSNPQDVARKIAAIPSAKLIDGTDAAVAKGIADAASSAPFATDLAAGQSGLMAPVMSLGVISAVAVPAFMDYQKKPRRSLAELQLHDLEKHAKAYYVEHSEYPKGTVAPGASCCLEKDLSCHATFDDPVWKALDFSQPADHQMYRFGYTGSEDGKSFTAIAVGDLDCDMTEVTWTLTGTTDAGNPITKLAPPTNQD